MAKPEAHRKFAVARALFDGLGQIEFVGDGSKKIGGKNPPGLREGARGVKDLRLDVKSPVRITEPWPTIRMKFGVLSQPDSDMGRISADRLQEVDNGRLGVDAKADGFRDERRPVYMSSIPQRSSRSTGNAYFRNCAAARSAGAAPLRIGQPGYRPELDADGDGIACEPYRGR